MRSGSSGFAGCAGAASATGRDGDSSVCVQGAIHVDEMPQQVTPPYD